MRADSTFLKGIFKFKKWKIYTCTEVFAFFYHFLLLKSFTFLLEVQK